MGKVDCVMEACQESYDKGVNDVIRKVLVNSDLSVEEIAGCAEVPLERVLEIKRSLQ